MNYHRLKRFVRSELILLFVKNRKWNYGADCLHYANTLPKRWEIFRDYDQVIAQLLLRTEAWD